MKKVVFSALTAVMVFGAAFPGPVSAASSSRFSGRFFIQVQSMGEAWYVKPDDGMRVFVNSENVSDFLSAVAIGISEADLSKIPVASFDLDGTVSTIWDMDNDGLSDSAEMSFGTDSTKPDSDDDGFADGTEVVGGYDPLKVSPARMAVDSKFAAKHAGKFFVQNDIKMYWYVNPADNKRYFVSGGEGLLPLIKQVATGITNANLEKITAAIPYGDDAIDDNVILIDDTSDDIVVDPIPAPTPVTPVMSDLPNCGTITLETGEEDDARITSCFDQYLKECKPAQMNVAIDFYIGVISYDEVILGMKDGTCQMSTEITSFSDPAWVGKSMSCPLDTSLSYRENESNLDLKKCNGELATIVNDFIEGLSDFGNLDLPGVYLPSVDDPEEDCFSSTCGEVSKTEILFDSLSQGVYDGPRMSSQVEITNDKQLRSFWLRLHPFSGSRPAQPSVNFEKEKVIVFFSERGNADISVKNIFTDEFFHYANITEKNLIENCNDLYQVTQAFHMVKVPLSDKYMSTNYTYDTSNTSCKSPRVSRSDFIYTNKDLDVAFELPDPVAFFDIKVMKDGVNTWITFSQMSVSENKSYVLFKILAIPHEQRNKQSMSGSKIGSNGTYAFFQEMLEEDLPDDVGSYYSFWGSNITLVK